VQDKAHLYRKRLPARRSQQARKSSPFISDSKKEEWTTTHNLGIGNKIIYTYLKKNVTQLILRVVSKVDNLTM
jgi:hypothetical protein